MVAATCCLGPSSVPFSPPVRRRLPAESRSSIATVPRLPLRGVRRSPAGSTSCAAATPCIPLPSASAGTGKPWPRAMASRRPIPSRSVKLSNFGGRAPAQPSVAKNTPVVAPPVATKPAPVPPAVSTSVPAKPAPAPASTTTPPSSGATPVVAGPAVGGWAWPASGTLIGRFASNGSLNKGIDIAGQLGQPVLAASGGTVVYAGSGLRGYGELVIIKHNETYVSAYGHNRRLLVREGQQVKVGQSIAEMGSTGTDRVKLHFEIRRQGKPVDPLQYLPRR